MDHKVEIYKTSEGAEVLVQLENDTVWLNRQQLSLLFDRDVKTIGKHINTIYKEKELESNSTVAKFATVQMEGNRKVERAVEFYNLDVIISLGYRVKSQQGVRFRQWATQRLKDFLIKGYAINEKRLKQKQQEVEFLKTGLRIVSRALEEAANEYQKEVFHQYAKGLALLDDYDYEELDKKGFTIKETIYPDYKDYIGLINLMYSDYDSYVFAKQKDDSFHSSINQIKQSFGGEELYPSIEEKAANLLYYITKNHSFVDGNKRIAAACFLYFLKQNNALYNSKNEMIISNETLATLTLYIANSRSEESEIVKKLIISVLNRNL